MPRRPPALARLAALAVLLALVAAAARPAAAKVFDPESFTLDNGLQVVVVNNSTVPIVTQMIWYRAGAADEPAGKSGVAHLVEHLMFKGTKRLAPGEFSDIVARNGGRENAFTSYDYTGYFQSVARDRLELVMRLEAERMQNLLFAPEQVRTELSVVLEERRSRVDNDPGAQLREMAQATLYLQHPYGTPVIGWEHELRGLTADDARAFYERWYAPNNAVLVVAGDVTAAEVRPIAERTYGQVPRADVPERRRLAEPEQLAPRRVELTSPRAGQPQIVIRYLAPGARLAPEGRAAALQVLSEVLGGGTTSRLYRNLVVERGLAAGAGTFYDSDTYDMAAFGFYATPRPGIEVDRLEAALREEIAAVLEEGVAAEAVEAAKHRLRAQAVYARDSVNTAPRVIGSALVTGQSLAELEAWPETIAAVTAGEIAAAADAVLVEARSVTSVLRTEPTS